MNKTSSFHKSIIVLLVIQLILSIFAPDLALARTRQLQNQAANLSHPGSSNHTLSNPLESPQNTTLSVNILSAPWTVLDSNDPAGTSGETPKVFIVQAEVTNTGIEAATNVVVTLDYDNPANNWILLGGENPTRTVDQLAPGESYYAYWFARYPTIIGATFQYSVTADATNADPVTTSDNFYGNPVPGSTVQTRSYISTGNSGVVQTSANVVVGVAFTVTVTYDLGSNPQGLTFSPAGNLDFDPGAYRLLSTQVRFYNDAQTQESTVPDRLFYNTVPAFADNADASFTFIAVAPENTVLCPYAAVDYNSTDKYDNFYCRDDRNTSIPITGSLSISMTKQVSSSFVQQGQTLDYTIHYTNTGTLPLQYVWIWDDIDTSIASIVPGSITPTPDPIETTNSLIAWNIDNVAVGGQPGSSGTLSFSVLIDGNGNDLPDNTLLVNDAHLGINPGSLPVVSALDDTTSTTVQAPTVAISKSDGQLLAEAGSSFMYTLNITNTGSVAASGLVITDVIPAELTVVGPTIPPATSQVGQTLTWSTLGPIAASGGTITIQIPVSLAITTPSGTVLTNTMAIQYENPVGYRFANETADDVTTVVAPTLSISKSDSPDPVLAGNELVYTLHYVNTGAADATNVTISDNVPTDTTYQACDGGISCVEAGGVVTWTIGTVAGNSSEVVTLTVLVSDTLSTGTILVNDTYGISSDQSGFIAGAPETTTVNRDAAIIQGYAFNDANGNGVKDVGETSGYNNLTVTLGGTAVPLTTTTTAGDGFYSFRLETGGPISVSAPLPGGTFRTTPGQVFLNATLGVTETVNFGYADNGAGFGVVFGTAFEDADSDGSQALGEMGLSGVQIAGSSAMTTPVSTNNHGQYTLRFNAATGTTIIETDPTHYVSTTPNEVPLAVVTGSSNGSPVNFGDFLGIKVAGQVFEDLNVNGNKDLGEGGVAGAGIAASGLAITTTSSGVYTMYISLDNGNPIEIAETDPPGYVSTNAVPGTGMTKINTNLLMITAPISGTVYSDGDFGDALASNVITITGQVWDDNGAGGGGLSNGILDGTEPGLAGALVELSSGLSQTTGSDGAFLLYAPPGQSITVTETNPATYVSTNAVPGNNAVKLGQDKILVSALSGGSTSSGNLFGDVLASNVAAISGTVFDDSNENGQLDGELGIPGVQVTLHYTNGHAITVTTDANGDYEIFAVAPGASVSIQSHGPGGLYYATTPETVYLVPQTPGTYTGNNFGYSDDGDTAVITGIVFDDINSDGVQGFGELGLAGAMLTLDGANPITTTGNGLITGTFTYAVSQVANYALDETNPPGYRSTTPDNLNVVVDALGTSYFVEFGDTNSGATGTVFGTVFDDMNGNGLQDMNEAGLPGVVISMTVGTGVLTATTKPQGQFTYGFELDEVGFHTVEEQDPALPGYHSTTPDAVNVLVELNVSKIVDFGDTANNSFSTIMGTVFNDESSDGDQDPAELGIMGVVVSLSNGMTTTTDLNGNYTFPITETGFLDVIETDPPGYHSTTPNEVTVDVDALGQVYLVNFGDNNNPLLTSIFGTVFDDQNVNGQKDGTELGLSDVTVAITGTFGQQQLNELANQITTNEWGQYTFLIENTGVFTVTEADLPGYVSTNAIPDDVAVIKIDNNTLRANVTTLGTDLGNNLFADVLASQVITITGEVWNDNGDGGGIAGDGVRDVGEPGLAGAFVSLSSGTNQTTGSSGAYLLYGPPNQAITVTESNPVGYLSTNAIPGNDAVKIDDDTLVVSALSAGSVSANNLFGDILDANIALIFGTVFEDSNGNGVQDSGEIGIPNVEITLDGTLSTTTDNNGDYFFATDVDGVHTVVETDLAGYFSTTPNEVHVTVVTGQGESYEVNFGDAPNGSGFASILGTVFEDLDGDGQWDADELGLANITITLDDVISTTTDQYGSYSFSTLVTGTHKVVESDPVGYFSTTPNEVHVNVSLGEDHLINFGDAPNGSGFAAILGTVFEDLDGDGQWDADELGIAGVTVTLDGSTATTTDANGSYNFSTTVAGIHEVVETDLPGYFSTTPNTVNVAVALGQGYEVNFGDALNSSSFATIFGTVFEDLNGNGQQDTSELGIPGVTVTLDEAATAVTDQFGNYSFATTVAGVHKVVESDPAGYFSTTPNEVHVTVAPGNSYEVNFGDAPDDSGFAAVYGTVFDDVNTDGVWDADEVGISGVNVDMDGTTATTNQYGSYTIATAVAGSHTVVETDLPGYVSTTPNIVNVTVVLNNGYQVDFGDVFEITCINDVYEEDDAAAQTGTISVDDPAQVRNFCDDATDWASFTAEAGQTYTVTTSAWGTRADTVLALYDTDGSSLLMANDDYEGTIDFSSQLVWDAPADGVYFVQTTNKAGLTQGLTEYDLWIEQMAVPENPTIYLPFVTRASTGNATAHRSAKVLFSPESPSGEINHMCSDSYEIDDTWEEAQAIAWGEVQTHSFDSNPALYAADKDHVWVDLNVDETVFFTVTLTLNTQTQLELVDDSGEIMGVTGTTHLQWTAETTGRYILEVSPTNTQTFGCEDVVSYDLTASVQVPDQAPTIYLPFVTRSSN